MATTSEVAAAGVQLWLWKESAAHSGWMRRKPKGCRNPFWEKDGYRMGVGAGGWTVFLIDDPNYGTDGEDRIHVPNPTAGVRAVDVAVSIGVTLEEASRPTAGPAR